MPLIQPNSATKAAVAHPLRYAATAGVGAAALGAAGGAASGALSAVLGAILAFLVVFLLTFWLWRSGGPGRRWAERRGVSSA